MFRATVWGVRSGQISRIYTYVYLSFIYTRRSLRFQSIVFTTSESPPEFATDSTIMTIPESIWTNEFGAFAGDVEESHCGFGRETLGVVGYRCAPGEGDCLATKRGNIG